MQRTLLLAALCLSGPWAYGGERMESTTHRIPRSAADSGGDHWPSSAGGDTLKSVVGEVAGSSCSSAGYQLVPGLASMLSFPNPVTNLTGLLDVSVSSVTLQWTAPGIDGGQGVLQAGSTYFIHVASFTSPDTFALANATWTYAAHGKTPGDYAQAGVTGLLPNTTYYSHIWVVDAYGDMSYSSERATFTTLASPVEAALESFSGVYDTSITVTWVALPEAPPDASSRTAEGYVVLASSTNWGALLPGGVTHSSATTSVLANALSVGADEPLDYCTTYYFRVGTLNWSGLANYAALPATPTLQDWGVNQSTHDLDIGNVLVGAELYMSTSVWVTNTGNCPATFALKAEDVTPGTPWTVASSSATDTMTVQAVFNPTQPGAPDFEDEDKLSNSFVESTETRFALGQSGVAVKRGESRLIWVKLGMPKITSTDDPQVVRVTVQAVEPPP